MASVWEIAFPELSPPNFGLEYILCIFLLVTFNKQVYGLLTFIRIITKLIHKC